MFVKKFEGYVLISSNNVFILYFSNLLFKLLLQEIKLQILTFIN